MIIDYHTHVGLDKHYSEEFRAETNRMRSRPLSMEVDPEEHDRVTSMCDKVVCLAFMSRHLGLGVTNEYVAEFISRKPEKYIGFASVDPHDGDAPNTLRYAHRTLGLRGLKMSPIYQAYHPMDERMLPIYRYCEDNGIPILLHQGTTFPRRAPLKYANPTLLEDVALAFPELRMIIAHLGHPWEVDTIAVLRKHPHIYADISGLFYRPWQFYNSMVLCTEYGVLNKLIFGSDYPVATPEETLAGLRRLNDFVEGTKFPRIPSEQIEALIHRNFLKELNLA